MEVVQSESLRSDAPWVVVNTHPHREHIAIENLGRQEFHSYCPKILRRVRHARKVQDVLRPLFPGYVFVQVDQQQRWRPILSTMGVRSLVRFGDRMGTLSSGFVESLMAREVDGVILKPEKAYTLGQHVKINGGPFDGVVATIIAMDEKDRLVVLMDLLNQSVKVKVATTGVAAV